MMNVSYFNAVKNLVSGEISGPDAGPISEFIFHNDQTPPTEEAIQTEVVRLQAEFDALAYSRARQAEYDSIGNQLDMIYKDNLNGTTTHKASVEAVKAKYPKPE
tara:strand:- start:149 stop:460 length:312 start_codon:yes stop_codon:yes gene_type:complete